MDSILTETAKDIKSIYASYDLSHSSYRETTESESYLEAKNKWLILKVRASENRHEHLKQQVKNSSTESL